MTDHLADTPVLGRSWCPACEPERDPTREILDTRYCDAHRPATAGDDDARVADTGYISGTGDTTGEACRAAQRLIR